jgi:hypothetical protein
MSIWLSKPPPGVRPSPSWIQDTECKGLWLFNEAGGNKVYDLSGNNNHGTMTNMAFPPTTTSGWTRGKFGSALAFDGSNDYVLSYIPVSQNITITAWIYPILVVGMARSVFAIGTYDIRLLIDSSGTKYSVDVNDRTISGVDTTADYVLNQWQHVVVVTTSGDTDFYLNGRQYHVSSNAGTLAWTTNEKFNIGVKGYNSGSADFYFNGLIDMPAIYNKALSAQEIARLYATPFYMFPKRSPVSYFIPSGEPPTAKPFYYYAQM